MLLVSLSSHFLLHLICYRIRFKTFALFIWASNWSFALQLAYSVHTQLTHTDTHTDQLIAPLIHTKSQEISRSAWVNRKAASVPPRSGPTFRGVSPDQIIRQTERRTDCADSASDETDSPKDWRAYRRCACANNGVYAMNLIIYENPVFNFNSGPVNRWKEEFKLYLNAAQLIFGKHNSCQRSKYWLKSNNEHRLPSRSLHHEIR